jgi:mannose-1-phosphate guanylyltransferase
VATAPDGAFVAILAGGEGTRLWPLSRGRRPKQLLSLTSDRSLLQQTVDRVRPLVPAERILIITEASHADDLRAQLPELPAENILVEPTRRSTAAALLLAALHLEARAPEATWSSLHSDAFISDDAEFRRTLAAALEAASSGAYLVTTGVRPRFPSTEYGYIQQGNRLGEVQGLPLYQVRQFVEKPGRETAQAYFENGDFLWNPGVFTWKNSTLLSAFETLQPELYGVLRSAPLEAVASVYGQAPKQSIDVGIMERARNVATLPATFGWSDIGSWAELWELSDRDQDGNVALGKGRALTIDSMGNLVMAEGRTVALVGVEDLVIVETTDAVFVCARDRARDVRMVVQRLREEGRSELL